MYFKKTTLFFVFIITCISVNAQVLWDFRLGTKSNLKLENANFGLGLDIPLQTYDNNLSIQPALRLRFFEYLNGNDYECVLDDGNKTMLEIPVKMGYKYPVWKNTNVRFSAGPYATLHVLTHEVNKGLYQAGLATAATYEYKNVNFGFEYNLPFYRKCKNAISDGVLFTMGVKFKSKTWKTIGKVAGIAAIAGASAVVAYEQTFGKDASDASEDFDVKDLYKNGSFDCDEAHKQYKHHVNRVKRCLNHFKGTKSEGMYRDKFLRIKHDIMMSQHCMRRIRDAARRHGCKIEKSYAETYKLGDLDY